MADASGDGNEGAGGPTWGVLARPPADRQPPPGRWVTDSRCLEEGQSPDQYPAQQHRRELGAGHATSTGEGALMQPQLPLFGQLGHRQNLLNITVTNVYTANERSNSTDDVDVDLALFILTRVVLTLHCILLVHRTVILVHKKLRFSYFSLPLFLLP